MAYSMVYKCRLCGKAWISGSVGIKDKALECMLDLTLFGEPKKAQGPSLLQTHFCDNGNYGLSDFQGFIKEEQQ